MKKSHRLICMALLLPVLSIAQGIRKNFNEMTQAEQDAYVNALNGLYNDDPTLDIVQTFSNENSEGYYWNYYEDVFQASCEMRQFLPFHRMMLWEMENALQRKNPRLTIPYWDWRVTNSSSDNLFTGFLNPYKLPAWNISRDMASYGSLPDDAQVQTILNASGFCNNDDISNSFNDQIEYPLTTQVTYWVGGTSDDPRDPIFFLHHAMVDKLWQQWEMSTHGSWSDVTVLDRYDGSTNGLYVSPLPYTSPSSITDSRTLGVFYAENGVANLDWYQVQNTYQNPENFSYPNKIVATNFTIPAGKNAVFTSANGVELGSGFVVDGGNLEIDVGANYYDNFPLAKKGLHKPIPQQQNASENAKITIVRSVNGFVAHLQLENASDVQGYVTGIDGKIISRLQSGQLESGLHDVDLNVSQNLGGLYFAYFHIGDQSYKRQLPRF